MTQPKTMPRKPESHMKVGKERIGLLFWQASKVFDKDPAMANRYVTLARRIAMRFNIRLEKEQRRSICSRCHSYIVPGMNCTARTSARRQALVITCSVCGHHMRFPYSREKSERRRQHRMDSRITI